MAPRYRRPKTVPCRLCKRKLKVKAKGPLPLYCRGCRQQAYERRRHGGVRMMLAQDIATAKIREVLRKEVVLVLTQLGLITNPPPAPPSPPRPKPRHLQMVRS